MTDSRNGKNYKPVQLNLGFGEQEVNEKVGFGPPSFCFFYLMTLK